MFINPDEPRLGQSISQYIIPQQPTNQSYYYNGGYGYMQNNQCNPFDSIVNPNINMPSDSRRNVATQYAPYTGIYNAPDPFATASCQTGLNSFVETRRDINNNNSCGNNPWIQNNNATTMQTSPYNQQQFGYVANDPFNPYNCVSSMVPVQTEMSKKDGYWINQYTEPQRLLPPTIDWYHDTNQSLNNCAYPYPTAPQFPRMTEQTWCDIAKANWNM